MIQDAYGPGLSRYQSNAAPSRLIAILANRSASSTLNAAKMISALSHQSRELSCAVPQNALIDLNALITVSAMVVRKFTGAELAGECCTGAGLVVEGCINAG